MAELGRPSRKKEGERERGCGLKGGERKVGRQVVAQVGFEKKKRFTFFYGSKPKFKLKFIFISKT